MKQHRMAYDFSKHTLNALTRRGIFIIGPVTIPGIDKEGKTSFLYNTSIAYQIDDNDTGRVVSFQDVIDLANKPIK